jgi:hypothetical protein
MKLEEHRWEGLRQRLEARGPVPIGQRRQRWSRLLMVAVLVGLIAAPSWFVSNQFRQPAEAIYTPAVDAYVSTAHPRSNYGATSTLRADATPKIRSYLRFRLDGLSGRVAKAELRLWSKSGNLVGYSVHSVSKPTWDEMSITSSNAPPIRKSAVSSGPFGPQSWSSVDVSRLVRGTEDVSMMLSTLSGQTIEFDSREGQQKPQLVVQTVPS